MKYLNSFIYYAKKTDYTDPETIISLGFVIFGISMIVWSIMQAFVLWF